MCLAVLCDVATYGTGNCDGFQVIFVGCDWHVLSRSFICYSWSFFISDLILKVLPLNFPAWCFLAKTRHFIPHYDDFILYCNWHHIAIYLVDYIYGYHLSIFFSDFQTKFLSWQCSVPSRRGTHLHLLFVCMFLLFLLALTMCILSYYLLYSALMRPLPCFPGLAFH